MERNILVSPGTQLVLELGAHFLKVRDMEKGTIENKDPEGLVKLISLSKERSRINIGRVPDGLIDLTVEEPDTYYTTFFIPGGNRDVRTNKRTYKNIAYPALIFFFKVVNQRITETRIAALKGIKTRSQIKDGTKLYQYPFAHGGIGHVCWGNIVLPDVPTLESLSMIPYAYWFNGMSSSGHGLNMKGMDLSTKSADEREKGVLDVYDLMEKGELMAEDYLCDAKLTYAEFVKRNFG